MTILNRPTPLYIIRYPQNRTPFLSPILGERYTQTVELLMYVIKKAQIEDLKNASRDYEEKQSRISGDQAVVVVQNYRRRY